MTDNELNIYKPQKVKDEWENVTNGTNDCA